LFLTGWVAAALAQEPPLDVPKTARLTKPTDVLAVDEWSLYPAMRIFSVYSDNFFLSPTSPISAIGFGITPSLTAEWTNGIHTTTIYGNAERQFFPWEHEIDTFDRQAGFTQKYSPLPDLVFKVQGDYTHKTIAPSLTSAIPNPVAAPQTSTLPNGNTVLPNGTIISPDGQVVGQTTPGLVVGPISVVNPFDQFTGTVFVDKYFNRGIVNLSSSISRTDYENPSSSSRDFTVRTFRGHGAFWLDPVFYAYSDGVIAATHSDMGGTDANTGTDTTAFRAFGGIGFRLNQMFGGSVYYGRQGSESQGGTAGGDVFGANLSYKPTPAWTVSASLDETINISNISSPTSPSNLALTLPVQSPLLIPLSSSTRITSTSLQADYTISRQWMASGHFGYTRVDYVDSTRMDNVWLASALLRYEMWKNLTLTWEYQFTSIVSNAPQVSANRNYVTMGATYKFQ